MANGTNGIDPLESSWMSKHVRPTLAWSGALVYFSAMYLILPTLVADKEWAMVGVVIAIPAGFAYWYFNVRTQAKNLEGLLSNMVSKFTEKLNLPKADGGAPTATEAGGGSAPIEEPLPEPVAIQLQQVKKFNLADFKARVIALCDSVISWQKKNPSSLLNAAINVYWGMIFDNTQAHKDTLDALIDYAKESFREIWGLPAGVDPIAYATEHMNDNLGCTTCGDKTIGCTYPDLRFKSQQLGEGYYTILIRLEDFILQRKQLDQA